MFMEKSVPKPFMKWAGGKSKLVQRITARLPAYMPTYHEPFLGGGATLFELARQGRFKKAIVSDANPELVALWTVVQRNVDGLIRELSDRKKYAYSKDRYLEIRGYANSDMSDIQAAARTLYLNKTCFNGLYRVNRLGEFNVPFGRYVNPTICDEAGLRSASRALANVTILNKDFEKACKDARPGDGVYFDPPYIPASFTSKFTSYTASGFRIDEHERLASLFGTLARSGVRVVLSNSMTKDTLRLYGKYDRDEILGSRNVGGPASYRNPAKEVIVFAGPLSTSEVVSATA
jgi:DNA adenine methylase